MTQRRRHGGLARRCGCAALTLALGTAWSTCARADDDLPGMHYSVGVTALRDDNLFRLPDGQTPAEAGLVGTQRDDLILVPFVDIEGRWQLSRQQLLASLNARADRYTHHDVYNDQTLDYALDWRWALAQSWDGRLAVDREQQATSLADYRGTHTNLLTVRALHAAVNLRPRPDRRATLAYDDYLGSNSLTARNTADYHISTVRAELGAVSALAHEVWFTAARTEGRYPNRQISWFAPVDNSYSQNDLALNARLASTEATQIDLSVGHAWRRYEDVSARNFTGPTGNLNLAWQASAKLTLKANLAEEIGAVDDYDRLYATTRSKSASINYQATAKLGTALEFKRKQLRYRGDPNSFLSNYLGSAHMPDRQETRDEVHANLVWQPALHFTTVLTLAKLRRAANISGYQYDAVQQQLTLEYQW